MTRQTEPLTHDRGSVWLIWIKRDEDAAPDLYAVAGTKSKARWLAAEADLNDPYDVWFSEREVQK